MATIIKPNIAPELLSQLDTKFEEEKQVIVHCGFQNNYLIGNLVRIWRTTFWWINLQGTEANFYSGKISRCFPYWTEVPVKEYWFTLIFLDCLKIVNSLISWKKFRKEGGFLVTDIDRNESDVYTIKLI